MASIMSGFEPGKKLLEKLKITPPSTRQQVEVIKKEIKDKISILRDKLNSLECDLIAEVERLAALQVSTI